MTDLWVYPLGTALGGETVDVQGLIDEFGPVRDGFLDRTGFSHVYRARDSETSVSLAVEATGHSQSSWWGPSVDALIAAGSTPERIAPGNAHSLQAKLGLRPDILLLDLNDACTGFVRSLHLAHSLVASGSATAVLVITTDTYSRLYSPDNLKISPLFSDGASAMIVSNRKLPEVPPTSIPRLWKILRTSFISEGHNAGELAITRGDSTSNLGHLEMNGAGVFNFVLRHLAESVRQLLSSDSSGRVNVDEWFVHQGSRAVVNAVEKNLGVPAGSLFRSEHYGNTVGSSIPFQLMEEPNDNGTCTIGFLAFGVGLTMAGMVIEQTTGDLTERDES